MRTSYSILERPDTRMAELDVLCAAEFAEERIRHGRPVVREKRKAEKLPRCRTKEGIRRWYPDALPLLMKIFENRPCWCCCQLGWCKHREPLVELAELAGAAGHVVTP